MVSASVTARFIVSLAINDLSVTSCKQKQISNGEFLQTGFWDDPDDLRLEIVFAKGDTTTVQWGIPCRPAPQRLREILNSRRFESCHQPEFIKCRMPCVFVPNQRGSALMERSVGVHGLQLKPSLNPKAAK
jgi:hypothetical protein